MNPRLLWLLALIMTVNVAGLAQTYNATFNNAPAETAIQILKKVTGHDFVYQKELIKKQQGHRLGHLSQLNARPAP